jgi:DNA-binding MarR family transcriptional regulator
MKLFDGGELEGEICPECVLIGPTGAAAKIRERLEAMGRIENEAGEEKERTSWVRLLDRRAHLLEETPSFSLAARQAAVRETRERR